MTEAPPETMKMIVHSVILRELLPGTLYKYRVANLKGIYPLYYMLQTLMLVMIRS